MVKQCRKLSYLFGKNLIIDPDKCHLDKIVYLGGKLTVTSKTSFANLEYLEVANEESIKNIVVKQCPKLKKTVIQNDILINESLNIDDSTLNNEIEYTCDIDPHKLRLMQEITTPNNL